MSAENSRSRNTTEPAIVRYVLTALALVIVTLLLLLPLIAVFQQAFANGKDMYFASIKDPDSVSAIKLTCLVAAIAVPLNLIFGLAAAWLITKFDFKGKNLLLTLIDLPFAVSPVVSGLIFVLMFGRRGVFHSFCEAHHLKIIFNLPGIVLATIFVTFPFVARELIPVMQAQGRDEEQAAAVLGANGWQTFWRVSLPNIRWGLLYAIILCNARAMGEFGAVSVVSGHVAGLNNTIPLQVEQFYDDYNFSGAFSLASVLAMLGIVTLIAKKIIEWRVGVKADR